MKVFGVLIAALFLIGPLLSSCDAPPDETKPLSIQADTLNEDWAVEWWMPRHKQKLKDKDKQKVDLIVLGDSITHGWESEGEDVWNQYYKPRNGFNLGFGGDRTENVLWRLNNGAVDGLSPKLLILMIGTNNTGHRMDSVDDTVAGIDAIIEKLGKKLPKTDILLLGIFPRGALPDDPGRLHNNQINQRLATLAEEGKWKRSKAIVRYRDIGSVFLGESGTISEEIMPDLLHLSPEGYRLWAEAIEADVARIMAD